MTAPCGGGPGDKDIGPLGGQPFGGGDHMRLGGIVDRKGEDGEMGLHDGRRAVQDLGCGIAFGLQAAGFLQFQRRFAGNGKGGTTAKDEGRRGAWQGGWQAATNPDASACSSDWGRAARAASKGLSCCHSARSAIPASTEVTKVLVAATDDSAPGVQAAGSDRQARPSGCWHRW